jgi:methyl-accepting chemotaxis protein
VTSSHQPDQPKPSLAPKRAPWTALQRWTIVTGVILSVALWAITPLAYDSNPFVSNLAWTLAAVSTLSVASYAWFTSERNRREARDRLQEQRDREQDERVRQTYERQEELGGQILQLLRDEAAAMEARYEKFVETVLNNQAAMAKTLLDRQRVNSDELLKAMELIIGPIAKSVEETLDELKSSWDEYNALLKKVRGRVGEVSQEMRNVSAGMRDVSDLVQNRERSAEERFREITAATQHLEEMLKAHALLVGGRLPDATVRPLKRPEQRPNGGES